MSDEAALLAAIYANHDEDTPRLVYADWLDEHGDPARAEFIRVQIELSHLADDDARERPLRDRRWELWEAHSKKWAADIGVVVSEKVKVEFRRGFIDELNLSGDVPEGVDLVCRVPGVRRVSLWGVPLTPDAIRKIAALDLDSLRIDETSFPREWLELLEPLPCGTVLDITPKDEPFAPNVWQEFQSRRISTLTHLTPSERYAEARRWQRGHDERHGYTRGMKTVSIQDARACDAEMQLLAELKGIENVRISECDLTAVGVEHIAKLPNLKSLDLFWVPVESIAPLARCTTLEELRVIPEYAVSIDDVGTEGMEQLLNLRELTLRDRRAGHLILARLGSLRELTLLDIELQGIENADSFAPLSNLTALEKLEIDGDVPGGALRFLAPCRKLQTMNLRVPAGDAEDFAALGVLTNIHELQITGAAVTDEVIRYLAPLKKLRTLVARGTEVTRDGARWLADKLPDITIILDESVVKSHHEAVTFCRRLAERDDSVSAQLPTHWRSSRWGTTAEPCRALIEDGWGESNGYTVDVSPAIMYLYSRDDSDPVTVRDKIARLKNPNTQQESIIEEQDLVSLSGAGTSCVYSFAADRNFVAVVAGQNQCAVLSCLAPAARFDEFRPLFLFVARSLRVGPAALEGVGEEITVPVSQL